MKKLVAVSGIAAIAIIGGLTACKSSAPAAVSTAPAVLSSAPAANSAPAATSVPTAASASAPAMTIAQQQAVDAAQGYLRVGLGFSQESLIQQLTSSAGNGFTQADAKFAVNYLNPNWDAQAVDAAKGYLQIGGFSRSSLIQQLTSTAGNGFTEAQAEYAVSKVGL
jgi:Host cell surface-exposed lipoprotein